MKAKQILSVLAASSILFTALACGNPPPPANQPSGDIIPLAPSTASAAPQPTAEKSAAPVASAAPSASAPGKPKPAPAGIPMVVSENEKEVTSAIGVSGGILRVGGVADLQIPRESLAETFGFTFALNTGKTMLKVTPYKGQIGDVYRVFVFRESASSEPVGVSAGGAPFVVKLPIKGAATANLAIGVADKGKAKFTVITPKSVLTADTGNTAVFEVNALPGEAVLHLTSAAP
jgi:hypothetical protein